MKSKEQLRKEDEKVYRAVLNTADHMGTDYIRSWWLNPANCPSLGLTTKEINRACRRLVRAGKLILDKENTSTSTGTCYRIVSTSL